MEFIENSILSNRELKIEHACWVIWPMGSMDWKYDGEWVMVDIDFRYRRICRDYIFYPAGYNDGFFRQEI